MGLGTVRSRAPVETEHHVIRVEGSDLGSGAMMSTRQIEEGGSGGRHCDHYRRGCCRRHRDRPLRSARWAVRWAVLAIPKPAVIGEGNDHTFSDVRFRRHLAGLVPGFRGWRGWREFRIVRLLDRRGCGNHHRRVVGAYLVAEAKVTDGCSV